MDLDAEMKGLRLLRARLDKLFDGGLVDWMERFRKEQEGRSQPAEQGDGPDVATMVNDLDKHVAELAETVTGMQQALEGLGDLPGKVEALVASKVDEALKAHPLNDPSVVELLDWLARNKPAFEELLTLGTAVDGTVDAEQPAQAAETANGAGSGATGTEAPAPAGGAQAAS